MHGGMRRVATVVVAGLAMISLSGCAALLLLPRAGDFSTSSSAGSSGSSTGSGSSGTSSGSGQPRVQAYSDGSTSERNNITKAIGERAGETNFDGTERLDTFIVTRIVVDPSCVNAAAPAENGHYLEVDLTVTTSDALGQDGTNATLDLSPANWYYYPGGGNGGVGASWNTDDCQVDVPPLTTVVGANANESGSIVLDVNSNSQWIAFAPYSNAPGWEWQYAAPTP